MKLNVVERSIMSFTEVGKLFIEYVGDSHISINGNSSDAKIIKNIDPILDEHTAVRDLEITGNLVVDEFTLVAALGPLFIFTCLIGLVFGTVGFILAVILSLYVVAQGTKRDVKMTTDYHIKDTDVVQAKIVKGVYAIKHSFFGYEIHLAIEYSDGDTFYTMYYLTKASKISICGMTLPPSNVDLCTDLAC